MRKLERNQLIELAGERVFQRGAEYFAWQRVRRLATDGGLVSAVVDGTHSYRVSLRVSGGDFAYACSCPAGAAGNFCKHCVAVSLSWLEGQQSETLSSVTQRLGLQTYLAQLRSEQLVELILEQVARDVHFRERLHWRAAHARGTEPDVDEQRRFLEFAAHAAASAEEAAPFLPILQEVENTLAQLLAAGLAERALTLIEGSAAFHLPALTEPSVALCAVLLAAHRKGCQQLGLAAEALAQRLLAWQLNSPAAARGEVTQRYSGLLGCRGWQAYHRLAQREWEHLSAQGELPTPEQRERSGRLSALLEYSANKHRDTASLIALKSRSLNDANGYLEIARLCQRWGEEGLALEWAQRGKDRFPAIEAGELYEFLAELYEARSAWQEALAIRFAQFCAHPSLHHYQRIVRLAQKTGELASWRERALSRLRKPVVTDAVSTAQGFADCDSSTLVSILLWENEDEAAWQAARQGGCQDDLWQELAQRRAEKYPEEALLIYQQLVARCVERKNRYSYERALETLRKIRRLLRKQRRQAEFIPYVESLCRRHRAQHSLIKMLSRLIARRSPARRVQPN